MLTLGQLIVLFVVFFCYCLNKIYFIFKQNLFHFVYSTLATGQLDTSCALTKGLSSVVRVTSHTVSTEVVRTIC